VSSLQTIRARGNIIMTFLKKKDKCDTREETRCRMYDHILTRFASARNPPRLARYRPGTAGPRQSAKGAGRPNKIV
jgi:hypothetical protein